MFEPIEIKRSSRFGSNYWESYSPKLNRNVKLFTDLEYEHWILVETNPDILIFCEKPKDIKCFIDNKKTKETFDMWVKWKNQEQGFISIFFNSELDKKDKQFEKNMQYINIQTEWCHANKYSYQVVTENEIRGNGILLKNMKILLSNIRVNKTQNKFDTTQILSNLINRDSLTIKALKDEMKNIPIERITNAICWLKYSGLIDGNFAKCPFSLQTEVWKNVKT